MINKDVNYLCLVKFYSETIPDDSVYLVYNSNSGTQYSNTKFEFIENTNVINFLWLLAHLTNFSLFRSNFSALESLYYHLFNLIQCEYYESTVIYFISSTSEKGCSTQVMNELTKFVETIEKYFFRVLEKQSLQSTDFKEVRIGEFKDEKAFNDILRALNCICSIYNFIYSDQLYDNKHLVFEKCGINKYVALIKIIITTLKRESTKVNVNNSTIKKSNEEHSDNLFKMLQFLLKLMSNISFGNNIDSQVSLIKII